MKRYLFFALIVFCLVATLPALGREKERCVILVGERSRNYSRKVEIYDYCCADNVRVSECDLSKLSLSPNKPYYISKDNGGNYPLEPEAVVLWPGGLSDKDNDGLSDAFEEELGTLDDKRDTDNDGIADGEEFAIWKGRFKDYDNDGIVNLLDFDSDNDGVSDGKDPDIHRLNFTDPVVFVAKAQNYKKIILAWDKSPEPAWAGYVLFSREEGKKYNYDYYIWKGRKNRCVVYIPKDKIYYFVLRAFDVNGGQSQDSEEVCCCK